MLGISGGSAGGTVAPFNPAVTVATTTTLGTGGTDDWWGRASIKRRPSDNALVMAYYRAPHHALNGGDLHIKFSNDDGATWTAEDTKIGGGTVSGFPMNPPGLTGDQDAGEPWLYVAPNGDLLLHMWKVAYGVSSAGSWQSRSTDGGHTWDTPTQIRGPYVGSYGFNSWLYHPRKAADGSPPPAGQIRLPAKESSRVPVIFDCAREWVGPEDTDGPYLYRKGPAGAKDVGMMYWAAMERHKDGINVLFLDGHGEQVSVQRLWKLKWSETFVAKDVVIQR